MTNLVQNTLLSQLRPGGTAAVEAYAATIDTEVSLIVVCNTTGSAVDFSIYHDDEGGDTFDQTTALHYQQEIPANSTVRIAAESIGAGVPVTRDGQIAVQTSSASALTFSIYGTTQSVAELPSRRG